MKNVYIVLGLLAVCGCGKVERVEWTAMGATAFVQTRGASPEKAQKIADEVKATFAHVEKLLDTDDPESEASRLALLSDAEILERCSPEVKSYYETAFELAKLSDGAFNPRWRGHMCALAKGCALENVGIPTSSIDMLIGLGGNCWMQKGQWEITGAMSPDSVAGVPLDEWCAMTIFPSEECERPIRDGRTGAPVDNGVESVMVVSAGNRVEASGLAVTLYILGSEAGKRFLDEKWRSVGVCALWTMKEGEPISHISHADAIPRAK